MASSLSNEKKQGMARYKILKPIATGGQAKVFQVQCLETQQTFAMKRYPVSDVAESIIKQEYSYLITMKGCPHVCPVHDGFFSTIHSDFGEDRFWCLILAFYEKGDLRSRILQAKEKKSLTGKGAKADEAKIMQWMLNLVEGVVEMHEKKLIHRDLNPANLFLDDDDNLKIGDFGISTQKTIADTSKGTPGYNAPEVGLGVYDNSVDMWSLGCILLDLLTLSIASERVFVPVEESLKLVPDVYSSKWKDVVRSLLKVNGKVRPKVATLALSLVSTYADDI